MYHLFGELVNDLCAQKRHTPLALQTTATMRAEAAHNDTIDHAIGWCVYTDAFLRRCDERNTRVAHRDFCRQHKADQAARNLWRKDHGLDRDPATAIVVDTRGVAADATIARQAPRPGFVSVYHQDGTPKRIGRIDFDHDGVEASGPLPIVERGAPRHSRAFPKTEAIAVPLPGTEFADYAPVEPAAFLVPLEEDAINYRELKGKAFLMTDEKVGDYDPGAPCPGCQRTPALCNCDLYTEVDDPEDLHDDINTTEEAILACTGEDTALRESLFAQRERLIERLMKAEPGYAGPESDDADRYIDLLGDLDEARQKLHDLRATPEHCLAAIAQCERQRFKPRTPEETARLTDIERLCRQADKAGRMAWGQERHIEYLEARLARMEQTA